MSVLSAAAMVKAPFYPSDYKPIALAGYLVVLTCFGGAGVWAALARVDSAVVSHGAVADESHLQLVQHLEGGIIRTIETREGAEVREGDVLFRLDDTQALANRDLLQNQFDSLEATEARLRAELDRAPQIQFAPDLAARRASAPLRQILDDQRAVFTQRRASLEGQATILRNRQAILEDELEGLDRERASAEKQLDLISDELVGVRALAENGLVAKSRKNALEREKARLDGVLGRNDIDKSKVADNLQDIELQIRSQEQKFQEDAAASLEQIRQKVSEAADRLRVAEDALRRTILVAPRSGVVQNVKVTTIGQVLRPGEVLLEIAPLDDHLVVEARVQPVDADNIHDDMVAEVRFPSFHARTTPVVLGRVGAVSHDRLIDETTKQPYFLAQIALADTDLPLQMRGRLRAGMPADVIFSTGERTALDYLLQPLADAMHGSFREK